MTKRERVLSAIEHKEVDRIPFMLELEPHTTLKIADFIKSPENILHRIGMKGLSKISPYLPTKEMRDGAALMRKIMRDTDLSREEFQKLL